MLQPHTHKPYSIFFLQKKNKTGYNSKKDLPPLLAVVVGTIVVVAKQIFVDVAITNSLSVYHIKRYVRSQEMLNYIMWGFKQLSDI